jgi:hypothetical protein
LAQRHVIGKKRGANAPLSPYITLKKL